MIFNLGLVNSVSGNRIADGLLNTVCPKRLIQVNLKVGFFFH